MRFPEETLVTPIYVKTRNDMEWPDDKVFYVLASNGLFLCRNYPFFRSCVPAAGWPAELETQRTFLKLKAPKVPRHLLEIAVGFFHRIGEATGAEAALLLIWDEGSNKVRLMAPKQRSTVYRGSLGGTFPVGVHYDLPSRLPEGWVIFGDIHSHVDGAAYSSFTDKRDEKHRPGLHIVVGRIGQEPPQIHVEAIVDGVRFDVDRDLVLEGYGQRRQQTAREWFDQVEIESYDSYWDYWKDTPKKSVVKGDGQESASWAVAKATVETTGDGGAEKGDGQNRFEDPGSSAARRT
jgi:PRTRC genetic system protein A